MGLYGWHEGLREELENSGSRRPSLARIGRSVRLLPDGTTPARCEDPGKVLDPRV